MLSNSQGGLSEAQLKELETKGSADLGDGVGPLIGCLAKEYQQVHWYRYRKKNLQKQNFLESKSDLLKYKIQAGAWPSLSLESSYLTVKGSEPRLTNFDDYDGDHPADW